MSSVTHLNSINNLLEHDKYHILFIYIIDEDGHYNGSYHDKSWKFTSCVDGETLEIILDECYTTLMEFAEDKYNFPFNINNIHQSVVFDCVQCLSDDEFEKAHDMERAGSNFQDILKAIQG